MIIIYIRDAMQNYQNIRRHNRYGANTKDKKKAKRR